MFVATHTEHKMPKDMNPKDFNLEDHIPSEVFESPKGMTNHNKPPLDWGIMDSISDNFTACVDSLAVSMKFRNPIFPEKLLNALKRAFVVRKLAYRRRKDDKAKMDEKEILVSILERIKPLDSPKKRRKTS